MNLEKIEARIRAHSELNGFDTEATQIVAGLIERVRQAQRIIAMEGPLASRESGEPIEHPAVKVERMASAEIRGWVKERPDLFGEQKQGGPKRERFKGFKAV